MGYDFQLPTVLEGLLEVLEEMELNVYLAQELQISFLMEIFASRFFQDKMPQVRIENTQTLSNQDITIKSILAII